MIAFKHGLRAHFIPIFLTLAFALSMGGGPLHAAPANAGKAVAADPARETALKPDSFAPKALLEELLVRRYSQEVATFVDRALFTLGAQIDLIEVPPVDIEAEDPSDLPTDLSLGTLSPEDVLKHYASSDVQAAARNLLKNYRVRAVTISVGVKPELGDAVKKQVEAWLSKRVSAEFGNVGKSAVTVIQAPVEPPKKLESNAFLDRLGQFQDLAGKLVLALVGLLAVMIWRARTAPVGASSAGESSRAAVGPVTESAGGGGSAGGALAANAKEADAHADRGGGTTDQKSEDLSAAGAPDATRQFRRMVKSVSELAPKANGELERVIRAWCQAGDDGRIKLACFAEALGKNLVKLPVPADLIMDISKSFSKMHEFTLGQRTGYLEKVYWDLMTTISVGPEALEPPFSYVEALDVKMIGQMLMEQNSRMKALVAIHMPDVARAAYFRTLDAVAKRELIAASAEMASMPAVEFKSIDGSLRKKLEEGLGAGTVTFDSPIAKMVNALTPLEELRMVTELPAAVTEQLLHTIPSLAFIESWPDESVTAILGRAKTEEVLTLLRVKPTLKDRLIGLSPRVMAEILADEIERPDLTDDDAKNALLAGLREQAQEAVKREELKLGKLTIVASAAAPKIAAVPGEADDSVPKAA